MGFLDEKGLAYFWEKARRWLDGKTAALMPAGAIVLWSGSADAIPVGWALCDGSNGTPNLQGRFVLGACADHPASETGGAEEVTLTVRQMPRHDHELIRAGSTDTPVPFSSYQKLLYSTINYFSSPSEAEFDPNSGQPNYYPDVTYMGTTGWSEPHPNMPPYYALAYIMKL